MTIVSTVKRSPSYPSMSLEDAVNAIKSAYKQEGKSWFPAESLAVAMGSRSLSGTARSRIGSLRQFGLVESDRTNGYRISDLGLAIAVNDEGTDTFVASVEEAFRRPEVYRDLWDNYRDASQNTLRNKLIVNSDYSEEAAGRLIDSFRESTRYIASIASGREGSRDDSISEVEFISEPRNREVPTGLVPATPDHMSFRFPLTGGRFVEVLFTGGYPNKRDMKLFGQYLAVATMSLIDDEEDAQDM